MTDFRGAALFDLSGATAVVVGGGSGLGLVMAETLLANGAQVCIASRSMDRVATTAAELGGRHDGRCHALAVDVTVEDSVASLAKELGARHQGGVNIVINCAGTNVRHAIEEISLTEWEDIQRANSTGGFLLARAMSPLLRAADWGRLINITSIFSSVSFPLRASYAASKGALLQLTRTLALEWAPHGITVNAISPGPFLTEINRPVLDDPENYRRFCENIALARFGDPAELATTCLFLASRHSSYVTGAEIMVDGGWTCR